MRNVIHPSFGIISEELFAYHSHAYVHVLLRFLLLILYISILHWETFIPACLLFVHYAGSTLSVNDTVLLAKPNYCTTYQFNCLFEES